MKYFFILLLIICGCTDEESWCSDFNAIICGTGVPGDLLLLSKDNDTKKCYLCKCKNDRIHFERACITSPCDPNKVFK